MKRSFYTILRSCILIGGLVIAGCGAMNSGDMADAGNNATTQPSNSSSAQSAGYHSGDNRSIGNGAFGESLP